MNKEDNNELVLTIRKNSDGMSIDTNGDCSGLDLMLMLGILASTVRDDCRLTNEDIFLFLDDYFHAEEKVGNNISEKYVLN